MVANDGQIATSAVTQLISEHVKDNDFTHPAYFTSLALQVQHNLQHQHHWTDITIHTHSPSAPNELLPRPLLSGLPPQRLYVHPDEQIELLSRESQRKKRAKEAGIAEEGVGSADAITEDAREVLQPEREWVLPTNLKEKWSLRRFAEVFDRITMVPESMPGTEEASENKWRTTKRVLLATVDSDSTVVYYIVHDGLVKPRQN